MGLWIICADRPKKEQMFEVAVPLYNEKKCFLDYLNFYHLVDLPLLILI